MEIIKADREAFDTARGFYHSLINAMEEADHIVTWVKDVYPSPELLRSYIDDGCLFFGMVDGEVAAAMALNHETNDGYRQA